jgi:hypothetical protein
MTAPAIEIVVTADTTTSSAMVEATAEGLPPGAQVQVVDRATPGADVVVTVRWGDESGRRATLHVRTRDGREAERVLSFGAADPDRERGRALGFAVAAMIPDDVRGAEAPTPAAKVEGPLPAPVQPVPDAVIVPSIADAKLWVDASAQGATGFVGSASSVGGAIAVRTLLRPFALRVGGAARVGEVSEADASSLLFRGDAGVGFFTVAFDPRVTLGGRAGLVVFHHSLQRTEDSARISGTHTLLGAEVLLEGSIALSSHFALVAAMGAEVAFGTTRVLIGPSRVAVIPAVRPVAELGVRIAF